MLPLLQVDVFQEKQGNQTIPIKESKKLLVLGLQIQITPPKVLHKCTTILQLKVYIFYLVQKLVGQPP